VSPFDDIRRCRRSTTFRLSPFDDKRMMSPFDDTGLQNTMRVTTAQGIGLAIRQRRQELGLSQQTLADRVNVSRQWIVEVEQGKPRAEIGLLLQTLDALALHVSIVSEKTPRETTGKRPLPEAQQRRNVDIDAIIKRARTRWT
jgi:HTH-type transcriptional regulator/antitoxin HipB